MHKRIEAELISLAHQILQMKDKKDVIKLKNKAAAIHEKLAVLEFVDNYFLTTPNASEDKSKLQSIVENIEVKEVTPQIMDKKEAIIEEKTTQKVEVVEEPSKTPEELVKQNATILKAEAEEIITKIEAQEEKFFKDDVKDVAPNSLANNEEFKDSIPVDVAADLFEKAEKMVKEKEPKPVVEKPTVATNKQEAKANVATKVAQPLATKETTKTRVNDRLFNSKLQVGLNDRIAFVKHLFNFSQEDFNRVLSQLNTFSTEIEAKDFLTNQVKPEYDWSNKEEYEARLIALIERKFM